MKRFAVLLTVLFVVGLFSVSALACDKAESASASSGVPATASADKQGDCPLAAAKAAEAGKDADAVQATSAACKVQETILAEMPACCATAVAAGEGCHGKDAAALNAEYTAMVTEATAELAVQASQGQGCCGKEAAAVQTKDDTEVKAKTTEVASSGAK